MKIIDEKGRLFGKINIIDLLVILLLLLFIPIFYFGYKLYNKTIPTQAAFVDEDIEIEKEFEFVKVKPDLLKSLNVGDKEIDKDGITIGEIVWLGESRPYQYRFDLGSGETFLKEEAQLKAFYAKLKLKTRKKNNGLFYKDKQVMINYPIEFKTEKYKVEALPILSSGGEKKVSLSINVVLKDLDDDKVKLVAEGDKDIDKDGKMIAEVLKVGKIENNSYEINLGSGNIMLGEDDNKKQIFVKLRINCSISKSGKLYFKNQEMKYASGFDFNTDKYSARAVPSNILINEKWVEVKIRFTGVIPELAKALTEGDIESDPLGRTVGRLKVIVSNKPTESSVLSIEQNKFVTIPQPFYKDITVYLDILCIEKEGILYFKNYPIKIGNMITLTTANYSIQGLIVGM